MLNHKIQNLIITSYMNFILFCLNIKILIIHLIIHLAFSIYIFVKKNFIYIFLFPNIVIQLQNQMSSQKKSCKNRNKETKNQIETKKTQTSQTDLLESQKFIKQPMVSANKSKRQKRKERAQKIYQQKLSQLSKILFQQTIFTEGQIIKKFDKKSQIELEEFINEHSLRQEWSKKYLNEKIRKQVTKSMIYLMEDLKNRQKNNNGIQISSSHSQLHIRCNIPESRKPFVNKYCIIQLQPLYQTMQANFNEKFDYRQQQIMEKVLLMFKSLYKCLQYLFLNALDKIQPGQEPNYLQQFDFLLFSKQKYIQQYYQKYYKQKGGDVYVKKPNHDPIHIGGLICTSSRFIRYIILSMLYHNKFLVNNIETGKLQFCQEVERKNFVTKCENYILEKIKYIQDYEEHFWKYLQKRTQYQMNQFRYQQVYDDFLRLVPKNSAQYYQTAKSMWKYVWQQARFRAKGKNTIIQSTAKGQNKKKLHQRRYTLTGQLLQKQSNFSLYLNYLLSNTQEARNFRKQINLDQISDIIKMDKIKQEIKSYHYFHYSYNQNNQGIIINAQTGKFQITSTQILVCDVLLSMIQNIFKIEKVHDTQTIIMMKGNLEYKKGPIKLSKLEDVPQLKNRLDLKTSINNFNKKLLITKKNNKRDEWQSYHKKIIQPIADIVVPQFYFQDQSNYSLQRREFYAIYNYKKMKFYITQEGDVKVENIFGEEGVKEAKQVFQNLKNYIHNEIYKQDLEKQKIIQKKKQQIKIKNEYHKKYLKMQLFASPRDYSIDYHQEPSQYYSQFKENKYYLTQRPTWTYQNQRPQPWVQYENINYRNSIKVLTWNIQAYRIHNDGYEKFQEGSDQYKQIKEIQINRIKRIVKIISQSNADIICLQEAYFLFNRYQDILKQLLFNQLPQKQYYYYPQYSQSDEPRDKTLINDRTIIISKFPMKYYNLVFQYFQTTKKSKDNSDGKCMKAMIISELYLNIKLNSSQSQSDKKSNAKLNKDQMKNAELEKQDKSNSIDVKILIGSIHLKAYQGEQMDQIRQYQLSTIENLRHSSNRYLRKNQDYTNAFGKDQPKFDMCILAGDFNSYDPPGTKQDDLSWISQIIRNKYQYQDAQDSVKNKDWTYAKGDNQPSVLDKVIFKIDQSQLKKRFKIIDVKPIGTQPLDEYLQKNPKSVRQEKTVKTPSDHIGRLVEFAFLRDKEMEKMNQNNFDQND